MRAGDAGAGDAQGAAPVGGERAVRIRRIRDALSGPEPPRGERPPGASAVLVPLFGAGDDLTILYTRRHRDLSRHAGEVSFPGGRVDPGDAGPLDAALREAREEVGIHRRDVDVLGHLTDFTTFYGARVSAYVGHVRGEPPMKPASPREVEQILLYPVRDLLASERYEGRRYSGDDDARTVHYWRFPDATVWGITGELTARLLRRCWGWSPPKAPEPVPSWDHFVPE